MPEQCVSAPLKCNRQGSISLMRMSIFFRKFRFWIAVVPFVFFLLNFTGCATVSRKESLPIYTLNGTDYIPLIPLCELRGIKWDYDTFTRKIDLSWPQHKINLMVGETLVLVDGESRNLKSPVDIYEGILVVPEKFREQILDALIKGPLPGGATPSAFVRIKRVVIDAGHGGNDPGAIGRTGLKEKDVNLDIAKRLAAILRARGVDVTMTRSNDRFIPLPSRVAIANRARPDLFVSIHSNANRVRSLNGFEVYYAASGRSDYKRAFNSAREEVLGFDESCFSGSSLDLKATLWDMVYTYNRAESITLARSLCRSIGDNLDTRVLGIKDANFYVLKNVNIPAVLIEIGFLSNSREEHIIRNGYYRQRIAEGIAEGIDRFDRDYASAEVS